MGGYAIDGCREFIASGEEGTAGALACAACGCHRNFHRREAEPETATSESSSPSSNGNRMSNLDISLGHVSGIISCKVTMPSVLALELLSTLEEILNQTSPKGHFLFVNECMYS
ncbi:hypothetical protein C3L33_18822, partial [Rhododendron williamsianum]